LSRPAYLEPKEVLMSASLDHLNLTVRNFEESVAWYGKVFGFSLVEQGVEDDGPWGILRSGDSMLCIYESPGLKEPNESEDSYQIYHFGLRVRDRQAWEETVKREKLETYYGSPVRYPHSLSWYITDPTGYMIEVALWKGDSVAF
jgi:catechol 2,3-dioxygenase-like lactoylglutathione lyase family enzyme